jgi:hypothetical protein
MSDRKRNHEKKEKHAEMEELDMGYKEMPIQNKPNQSQMQNICPMMYQCPMAYQCPMMVQPGAQMHMPYTQGAGMRNEDWFEEWDEFSEDSSFEFDSDDFFSPEKYYQKQYEKHHEKHHKDHQYPFFWPPYFPSYRK